MLRILLLCLCILGLSGCWQSNNSQFNTESLLLSNLPQRMVVSFNGTTGIISRVDGSQTTYEGFGFDDIKFKDVRMGLSNNLFVQVRNAATGQYSYFVLGAGRGHARDQLRGANKLSLGAGFPPRGGTVENNNFSPPLAGTKLNYRRNAVIVTDIDAMTDVEIAALVDTQKERSAAGRFDRAVWPEMLKYCNQAIAFLGTGSLGALMNSYKIEGDRCTVGNAFSKLSLGFNGLDNLRCTDGNPRQCEAMVRYNCLMTSSVANDQRMNRAICDVFRAARQPVKFIARDDGKRVVIEQFELVRP